MSTNNTATAPSPIPANATYAQVLDLVMGGKITKEQATSWAESQQVKATAKALTCKIGLKGGICLYGLGQFPVTLYSTQWERVKDEAIPLVLAFIQEHQAELPTGKSDPRVSGVKDACAAHLQGKDYAIQQKSQPRK